MKRWILSGIGIVGGALVIACGDQRSDAPAGPVASVTALTAVPACDLSQTSSLVAQYFNSTDAKTARGLIDQMTAAGPGTLAARNGGFDIIALIAQNAQAGTGGAASVGSDLINKVTPCMFQTLAELPETYPEDYTVAITTSAPGGLGVRGGVADPVTPVLSRGSFSGIAPLPDTTWARTLSGNAAPKRVAFFGHPGSTAQTYDWKVLPRNTTFNPQVVVGVCVDNTVSTTGLLHEEHVGLLTFAAAYFLDPEFCSSSVASRSAVSAFTRQLAAIFLPQPLVASGLTKGIGGSSGGIGSEFGVNNVPNVTLTFATQPPTSVIVGQTFSVQVRATDPATGATVGGARLSIVAVNNNGVPKELLGATPQTTTNAGIATFSGLSFSPSSTGGFRLVVSGGVLSRPSISVGQATSNKVNVKPAK